MKPPRLLPVLTLFAALHATASTAADDPFVPREWFVAPVPATELASPLSLAASTITGDDPSPAKPKRPRRALTSTEGGANVLNAERARTLLRSLTLPGWGQAAAGHPRSALTFAIAEAGVWTAFTSFRIQQTMRLQTSRRTAQLAAGVDLDGRDEEFLRIVGSFLSSEEYNQLVVTRDAANIFLVDPDNYDLAGYRDYIARNSLSGRDVWAWDDVQDLLRYRAQRRDAQRSGRRANTALAVAVANRILSALHAARISNAPPDGTSWRFEFVPDADDPTSWRAGLRADF